MDVNNVSGSIAPYKSYEKTVKANKEANVNTALEADELEVNNAAVFEKSEEAPKPVTYKPDQKTIDQLKSITEYHTQNLMNMVANLFNGQAKTFSIANGDDIWKMFASGDFTVDEATKAQAQADIAEDGFWGVTQTANRILDFAKALTGGDPSKVEEMRAAVKQGFEEAEKAWGGTLPEISQKTYDAVMKGFDEMAGINTEA
ncbi:MAG: hypothetical protein IJR47_05465 [Clostridia bacterium]|nr:hypothetical protein [Clostridia bacterium]